MNLSEIAQKNRRLKFWSELLLNGALSDTQKADLSNCLRQYQEVLNNSLRLELANGGIILEENIIKLADLERKLMQLAEESRLEAGKSSLLS